MKMKKIEQVKEVGSKIGTDPTFETESQQTKPTLVEKYNAWRSNQAGFFEIKGTKREDLIKFFTPGEKTYRQESVNKALAGLKKISPVQYLAATFCAISLYGASVEANKFYSAEQIPPPVTTKLTESQVSSLKKTIGGNFALAIQKDGQLDFPKLGDNSVGQKKGKISPTEKDKVKLTEEIKTEVKNDASSSPTEAYLSLIADRTYGTSDNQVVASQALTKLKESRAKEHQSIINSAKSNAGITGSFLGGLGLLSAGGLFPGAASRIKGWFTRN